MQDVWPAQDWRFNIAYNAALQLATAALAAAGFQAERANHHFRIIQSLALTLGMDSVTVNKLDAFRKKRNVSDYQRADIVSDFEAEEMRRLAVKLRSDVERSLRKAHPEIL